MVYGTMVIEQTSLRLFASEIRLDSFHFKYVRLASVEKLERTGFNDCYYMYLVKDDFRSILKEVTKNEA